jgi:DNA-binding CsgD family transcriptional regulator
MFRPRAEMLLGTSTDDRDEATAALSAAAGRFEACGALCRRQEALDALAGLGRPGQRAADQALGAAALSAREREIATLAAAGLTATEIGDRLFIGKRTVEGHLARAYAKLGVSGRVELARRADELGLAGGGRS